MTVLHHIKVRKIDEEQMCEIVPLFFEIYSNCNNNQFFSVLSKLK